MKYIKNSIKYIVIVLICVFCSYYITRATTYDYNATDVRFDNTGTDLESTGLQDALDEVFYHVSDYNEIKTTIGSGSLNTSSQNIIGAINEIKSGIDSHYETLGTAASPLTTLNDIPLNWMGHVVLDSTISPAGYTRAYTAWKTGSNVSTRYTILAVDQYDFKMYMYDMYESTSKGWKLLTNDYKSYGGVLASGTNLNNVFDPGVYMVSSNNTYTNKPDGKSGGTMVVLAPRYDNTVVKQIFYYSTTNIYVRTYPYDGGWSNWYKYSSAAL